MDHQDLRTLKLLEAIENDTLPSQRDLARKLNVSLGLVNSFIKRLAHKGYFKITTIPRNRISYMLTPKGAAEKTRLTYEYIQYSFEFYKNARQKLRKRFAGFVKEGVQTVVFFGANDLSEIAYISLQETPIQLAAVVDPERVGKKFLGTTITDPQDLSRIAYDRILITAIERREAVRNHLSEAGLPNEKICLID